MNVSLRSPADHPRVTQWLRGVAVVVFCLIVIGGFVRLSRAGLSIVEWNPVVGILPPMSDAAWQVEFAKYQQSPEFRLVNASMTMDGYRRIFYIEWAHRLLARLAGLAVVVPMVIFMWRGMLSRRRAATCLMLAVLFGLQGLLGWLMVASGLFETPAVSHYRLTIHLLMAILLFGLAMWTAMDGDASVPRRRHALASTPGSRAALAVLAVVVLQIAYGGLVAGLKAGHVSYSWPLMGGSLIPAGLFANGVNWATLTEHAPVVHWLHRWFAFAVVLTVTALAIGLRRAAAPLASRRAVAATLALLGVQMVLGITMLWLHLPLTLALLHQAVGLAVFAALVVANHRVLRA
ncbi:MAG: COX15/CtaA family protein [Acidobacteria bacterium]|nr:COX15/CtaA family protein [Acidobacteriota bacterium]